MERARLLIVDDDQHLCAAMARQLGSLGYDVQTAPDAAVALDILNESPVEVAVLDYEMPGLNGVELFRLARQINPQLAGIFVTGHARLDTVFSAIDAGMFRVLGKPVDFAELALVIEDCLNQASGNENLAERE